MNFNKRKCNLIKFVVFFSLIAVITLNTTFASESDKMTQAERELSSLTQITEDDINQKMSQFSKYYIENEKKTAAVMNEINDDFINEHSYYQYQLSNKSYEQIKKECRVIPDPTMNTIYAKDYTLPTYSYHHEKISKKQLTKKIIYDTPIYNTQLTHNYWKEAYSAYKTYSQYDEKSGLNDNEIFKNYFSQFLNSLKNKDEFFETSIKSHVDNIYYRVNGQTKEETTQEAFENYKNDLLTQSKAQALLDEYNEKCKVYKHNYLSQVGYEKYLRSINNTKDTWKFSEYCRLARKGLLAGIPEYPTKPHHYTQLKTQANKILDEVEWHQQITYTLCQSETPQMITSLNAFKTPKDKILSWTYTTLDSLYKKDISFNEPVLTTENKNTYNDILEIDYDSQFVDQRNTIINSLKSKLAEKYKLKDFGDKISENAQSKLGCRYYWGATGEDMFDCSGLVYWVMNHSGIKIDRLTANGYASLGTKIRDIDDMIPGDVIALGNEQSYGHIGIYIGNSKVVEAMGEGETCKGNHPQHVVKITDLTHFIHEDKKYEIRRLF